MKSSKQVLMLATAGIVAGCGGGGSGGVAGIDGGGALPPVANPPPEDTTITTVGTITGFGSVIVNGVRYETSSAAITVDDAPGSESDLSVGQVVVIRGTIDSDGQTGVATSVDYDDLVEGPIQSIDLASDSMVVLGQTILINGDTSFDDDINPNSLAGLSVGDFVEVSGFRRGDGAIAATYIDDEDSVDDFETTGIVENVDTSAMTFEIGGLVIDYSGASLDDFPSGMPENGQLVEAEGDMLGASGELIATEVELEDFDFGDDDDDEVEIEGLVTRFASATDFDVNGIPVTTNSDTDYEDGSSADLALNVRIEVEGSFNASGVLVAEDIEFEIEPDAEIGGLVEATGSSQITILDVDIEIDSGTEFEDNSRLSLSTFSLDDINVGDYVEVKVFEDGSGLTATRVEREDDEGEVFLIGTVGSVDQPAFTVLGVTVQTDAETEFEDFDETPIDATAFFSQAEGELVEVTGMDTGGSVLAEEVELED